MIFRGGQRRSQNSVREEEEKLVRGKERLRMGLPCWNGETSQLTFVPGAVRGKGAEWTLEADGCLGKDGAGVGAGDGVVQKG